MPDDRFEPRRKPEGENPPPSSQFPLGPGWGSDPLAEGANRLKLPLIEGALELRSQSLVRQFRDYRRDECFELVENASADMRLLFVDFIKEVQQQINEGLREYNEQEPSIDICYESAGILISEREDPLFIVQVFLRSDRDEPLTIDQDNEIQIYQGSASCIITGTPRNGNISIQSQLSLDALKEIADADPSRYPSPVWLSALENAIDETVQQMLVAEEITGKEAESIDSADIIDQHEFSIEAEGVIEARIHNRLVMFELTLDQYGIPRCEPIDDL